MNMTAIIITAIICFTIMVVVTTICKAIVEKEEVHQEPTDKLYNMLLGRTEEDDNARS